MKPVKIRFDEEKLCVLFCSVLEQMTSSNQIIAESSKALLYALKRYYGRKFPYGVFYNEWTKDQIIMKSRFFGFGSKFKHLEIRLFSSANTKSIEEGLYYIEVLEDENGVYIYCEYFYLHLLNLICSFFDAESDWSIKEAETKINKIVKVTSSPIVTYDHVTRNLHYSVF